jgi:type IV secretion/conjugal transfer VirB4 family ATPase
MLSLGQIRQDHARAGALNGLFAPWAFVDEHTFLTKRGHVGVMYRVRGTDYECLDREARRDVVHRYEAALRLLDERYRLYQFLRKRRIDRRSVEACSNPVARAAIERRAAYLDGRRGNLYEIDLFSVVMYEGLRPRATNTLNARNALQAPVHAVREWLSIGHTLHVLQRDLDEAITELQHRAGAFEVQIRDIAQPERLGQQEAFQFLRALVNFDPGVADEMRLTHDTYVDYFMGDSAVECHRGHLNVGGRQVRVLTMKDPPASTSPLVLEGLYTVPGEFIACLEWSRIPADRMRRDLHARRRHHFNRRVALVNYLSSETRADEMLVDESADATVRQLGDALTEIEVHGHFFGECSLTVVLHDDDPRRLDVSAAEVAKVLTSQDGAVTRETYNLLNAWLAIVPGNSAHNLRRLALLETHLADLSFLFTLDRGNATCPHLGREALATFETQHQTLFDLALHVDDVGHGVIVGATGSGKSFLLNFLLTHAQRYDPLTVVFDLGVGYQKLATLLRGSHLTLGLQETGVQINPFALRPTPENLDFLAAFLRLLLEGRDGYRLSDAEDRAVYECVENVYVLAPEQQRLFSAANLLPRALSQRLTKWIQGGRYGDLFDHANDTLTFNTFQVFNLQQMHAFPDLLEPLLFYVLHRVAARVQDPEFAGRLKVCVLDEAWRFIQHAQLRSYVRSALKTWRKHHGAMLLATQSIEDFSTADLRETVLESCPTRFLLANPGANPDRYAQLFHLNETELALHQELVARRQFLLKRPGIAKVLDLNVDAQSYGLYTNTPLDNERFNALVRDHGFDEALRRFAA